MRRMVLTSITCVLMAPLTLMPRVSAAPDRQGAPVGSPGAPAVSQAGSQAYTFPSGAGMLFFYVRPDKTADFEAVLTKVGEALESVQDPARKTQASGWRIFKSSEVARDAAIYVFFFDPAPAGADYDPVKLLGEALPAEAQGLYDRLKASIIRVERMGLAKIR